MNTSDLKAAENLRDLWEKHKREHGLRQMDAAEALGLSNSVVSQYLKGRVPLGPRATLRWAEYLGVPPEAIRRDWRSLYGCDEHKLDEKLLEDILHTVQNTLQEQEIKQLPADMQARLVSILYADAIKEGKVNKSAVRCMIRYAL